MRSGRREEDLSSIRGYPSEARREALSEKERLPAESMATGSAESVMVEALVPAVMERRSSASVRILLGLERRLSCTASDSPVVRASEI